MFELTEAAKEKLHRSLAATPMADREGKCFRIVPKDDRYLTLKLAEPAPSDTTFRHDGAIVLALPKALQPFFENKSLDSDRGGKLKLC